MKDKSVFRYLILILAVLTVWFLGKFLFRLLFPFLLGGLFALMAEPVVRTLCRKLPRGAAAGIGVSLTLVLTAGILSVLGALALRELTSFASALPDIQDTAQKGMLALQDLLISLCSRAPEGLQPLLCQGVLTLFGNGSAALSRAAGKLVGMLGSFMGTIPGTALTLGTAITAAYLVSARLPRLRTLLGRVLPERWRSQYVPALHRVRHALFCWFLAQGKLSGIVCLICTAGFLLLKIPFAPLWAFLTSLVDAVPMLGTGTVLIPWAIVEFLGGSSGTALGLLLIYGCALVTRTVLEPKLVGRHLGLDPLLTLLFLYLGYRFWGLGGMILFPILAAAVRSVLP